MIHQYAPHHLGRNREEMGAILPLHALVVHQAHVGFIYQGGGLERVAWALALHVVVSQAAKFFINDRGQTVERALVSIAPGAEELAYVVCIQLARHCRPRIRIGVDYTAAPFVRKFSALAVSKSRRILRLLGVEEHMKTILTSIAAGSLLATLAVAQQPSRFCGRRGFAV